MSQQVALITGAASGFGKALTELLAGRGVQVVACDVDVDAGQGVADAAGAIFVPCDVSDPAQNEAAVAAALEHFGGLDTAFLNAGIALATPLGDGFDLAQYRKAMGVNIDGVVFGVHAVLPALKARGGGAIVATASLAGLTAVPMDPIYAANKAAVVGLARSLGPALASEGITYNAICPGFAESKIVDDIREILSAQGVQLIPAETVAATVLKIITGGATGEAWLVQPGREPAPFTFRNVPGPRRGRAAHP